MTPKGIDMATQTDPEITGVDADDFEEESEDGSETESIADQGEADGGAAMRSEKGTSAKPIRKKIELKYYFGEDMPDAELKRCEWTTSWAHGRLE